ncbi:hypothetical protein IscW_ISCW002012 [Ixodes scapularis]|uniref:Uncharacterized protein n=1 Tax=Ixodes scapularis TaxID=6945 RepID=B7PBL2_IXOSC|nr:hypothetical protein IscW_ISCW002012 [Ixodes scapularis]|eukprot:XP_002408431.1 hypothetical protein IscW_ISCW002012 [Ixodes scapularis]
MLWKMEYGARTSDLKHWNSYHYYNFLHLSDSYFKRTDMVESIMERLWPIMDNLAKKVDFRIVANFTNYVLTGAVKTLCGIGHPSCVKASTLLWNEGSSVWQEGYEEFNQWVKNRSSLEGVVVVGMLLRFGSPEEQGTISSWIRKTDNKKVALEVLAYCSNVSFIEMFARENYMSLAEIQPPKGMVSTAFHKAAFRVAISMPEAVRRIDGYIMGLYICIPSRVIDSEEELNMYIAKLSSLNCSESVVDQGLDQVRVSLANVKRGTPGLLRWLNGELPPAVPGTSASMETLK